MAKWTAPPGAACDKCDLCTTANKIKIWGEGPENAEIMVILGAPDESEDRTGRPATGRIGAELGQVLDRIGLRTDAVYVTHAIKCMGPDRKRYLEACQPYIAEEIQKVRPKVVVTVGSMALKQVFGPTAKMTKFRGRVKQITFGDFQTTVFPTWDLAAILAGDTTKKLWIVEDFTRVKQFVDGTLPLFTENKMDQFDIRICRTKDEIIEGLLGQAWEAPAIAIDTETHGTDPHKPEVGGKFLVTVQMATGKSSALVIPVHHPASQCDVETTAAILRDFFENYEGRVYAHNGKFDQKAIRTLTGTVPKVTFDTMAAHNLLTGDSFGNDLKSMAWKYTDFGGYESEIEPLMEEVKYNTKLIDIEVLARYGALDTIATFRIAARLRKKIKKMGENTQYVSQLVAKLSGVLAEVESNGILLNWDYLEQYKVELDALAVQIKEEIMEMAGKKFQLAVQDLKVEEFNFASPRQIAHLLYKRMGIKNTTKTQKGAPSVSKDALSQITHKYPIAQKFLDLAGIAQNLKLYVRNYPNYRFADRIWPEYSMIKYSDDAGTESGTRSGRLSAHNPSIQQLPKETKGKVRKLIIPEDKDSLIIDFDYKALEFRVAAMYIQDPAITDALNSGVDYHTFVASRIFHKDITEVTKEEREKGKRLNFGMMFGAGAQKVARLLQCSEEDASELIEIYYGALPSIKRWKRGTEQFVQKNMWVDTLFGRRRAFPDVRSDDMGRKMMALRAAVNHQCQSAGADLCYTGIVRVNEYLRENGMKTRMLFTVHDSITFSSPRTEIPLVVPNIVDRMENTHLSFIEATGVSIKVDVRVGPTFGDLIDYEEGVKTFQL